MGHEQSVKEWKERTEEAQNFADEMRQRFESVQREAANRLHIMEQRLIERERELQDATYEVTRLMEIIEQVTAVPDESTGVEDSDAVSEPHLVAVDDENREAVKDLMKGMFDLELLAEADGFKMEGIDSEGNVVDDEAFSASMDRLAEEHPDVHAKLVG